MYHNDLTASVHGSIGRGLRYALWLRLYVESERRGLLRSLEGTMRCGASAEVTSAVPAAPITDRRGTARQLPRLLSCIRFEEVFVLQGAPYWGNILIGRIHVESLGRLSMFAVGSC